MWYFISVSNTKEKCIKINNYIYYKSEKQAEKISNSNKQADASSKPNEETHIIDRIRKLPVRQLFRPPIIGVIRQDLVMNVQDNSRVELSLESLCPLSMITSKAIVIGSARKSAKVDRNTLKSCTPPDKTI